MAASTQGYSGITRTELGIRNVPSTLQQITRVVAHEPANTHQVAAETRDVATVRGEIVLTNMNALMASCSQSLFIDVWVLTSC